jgi:hypothetical protein
MLQVVIAVTWWIILFLVGCGQRVPDVSEAKGKNRGCIMKRLIPVLIQEVVV